VSKTLQFQSINPSKQELNTLAFIEAQKKMIISAFSCVPPCKSTVKVVMVPKDDLMTLVVLLRNLRAKKRAKLEDVAKAMNITKEAYFAIEKGELLPDLYHLDDVAKFYGINSAVFNRYFK